MMEPEGGFDTRLPLAKTGFPFPDEILLGLVACPHPNVSACYIRFLGLFVVVVVLLTFSCSS